MHPVWPPHERLHCPKRSVPTARGPQPPRCRFLRNPGLCDETCCHADSGGFYLTVLLTGGKFLKEP